MTVFAIDSSSGAASAALLCGGELRAESYADVGLTHSETLLSLCDEVFHRAGCTPEQIDLFAVTAGPGSFTGLRIGMGIIKGMAFAAGKPCVAVPTLEAVAWSACPTDRLVVPVCDARRGRVYCAAFRCADEPERVREDCVMTYAELAREFSGERILFAGDAAQLCYNELKDTLQCAVPPRPRALPRAGLAAVAAVRLAGHGAAVDAGALRPTYLQTSQAERMLAEKRRQL
ncbi:MAG: tRNA (adenosine(37)-N6)-threonylcarbamoyltransferase complex dimerization subunit type 1 TsaB [Oscillospiraceae bacterium]|nr:tRNA (adenosine(37)-N6)-threonylcarbamoyltransferase complex dimerization subunit type 1 TsaB [Oscillospiraceae bacterium]